MTSPNFIPCLSFQRISPRAFIHQVIGNCELSTIALPAKTADPAETNQYLRLLIRLKWILQAWLRQSMSKELEGGPETSFEGNRDVLLRVVTYACDISSSISPQDQEWTAQYSTLRRITLQLLTCAGSLAVRLGMTSSEEDKDFLRNHIEDMVQGWSQKAPLSFGEGTIIREILALITTSSSQRERVDSPIANPDECDVISLSFDDLLSPSTPNNSLSTSFWEIHNWLVAQNYMGQSDGRRPKVVVVYYDTLGKFRGRPGQQYTFPLATYMMEELAFQVSSAYRIDPREEMTSEDPLLSNLMSLSSKEAVSFNKCFSNHVQISEAQFLIVTPERISPIASQHRISPVASQPASHPPAIPRRSENRVPPIPIARKPVSPHDTPDSPTLPVYPIRFDHGDAVSPIGGDDIRAYQYSEPTELPTRTQTRKELRISHLAPQPVDVFHDIDMGGDRMWGSISEGPSETTRNQSVVEEIHGGLEVVSESQLGAAPEYVDLMISSQLGLRPLNMVREGDAQSLGYSPSIAATTSNKSKPGLFGRFMSGKRPSLVPLPASLEFCFSSCARQILFWSKKNPDSIIRIQYPNQEPRRFEMLVPDAPMMHQTKAQAYSIRLLAATYSLAVALVHIEENRWLYILRDQTFHPIIAVPTSIPAILHLALSHDGKTIAMGCGQFILYYQFQDEQMIGSWKLDLNLTLGDRVVRLQKLSFSPDSRRLISAVQVEHSAHKHAVYVSVWNCSTQPFRLEAQLDPVYVTVGYSDDTGISAIFLTGPSDALAVQQAFLTAALSKAYPSLLPITSGMKNQQLDLADKRIESASQCPFLAYPHLCAVRSGRNKIFFVDTRTGIVEKAADFTAERKGLHLLRDNFSLAMQGPDTVCALWRSADENLVLKSIVRDEHGKWVANTTELGMIYRQAAGLL